MSPTSEGWFSFDSVWAPACQDRIGGGHAGVGVVSLGGASLSLPSFVTPHFHEFFKLGRAMRTTLPTAQGGVVHLFVVYGYQRYVDLALAFSQGAVTCRFSREEGTGSRRDFLWADLVL